MRQGTIECEEMNLRASNGVFRGIISHLTSNNDLEHLVASERHHVTYDEASLITLPAQRISESYLPTSPSHIRY